MPRRCDYKNYVYIASGHHGTMFSNQYNIIIDLIQKYQPKRICQLGCGQTTNIFQQYCQKYSDKILISIEHDKNWAYKNTIIFPLIQNSNITIEGNIYNNINKYDGFEEWLVIQKPFDFICIDGPPGWGFRENYTYSRVQLLSFILLNKINHNSFVLFHDSQRENSQKTLKEFQKLLTEKGFRYQKKIIFSLSKINKPQLSIYKIS